MRSKENLSGGSAAGTGSSRCVVGARLSPALPASLQLGMLYDQERFERAPEEMEAISVLFPSAQMRSVEYSCCADVQEGWI